MTCSNYIELTGEDDDTQGIGPQSLFVLKAGTISLLEGCDISANLTTDEIHILPSCAYNGCSMAFGDSHDHEEFHLTDEGEFLTCYHMIL